MPTLRLLVVLDRAALARWHIWLIEDLSRIAQITVRLAEGEGGPPASVALILELERLAGMAARDGGCDGITMDTLAPYLGSSAGEFDVAIDLTAGFEGAELSSARVLRPLQDGSPSLTGLWTALLDGRAPRLSIHDSATGTHVQMAEPAIEHPTNLSRSASSALGRLTQCLALAVRDIATSGHITARLVAVETSARERPPPLAAAAHTARRLAGKAQRVLHRMLGQAPRWVVAWRECAGNGATARDFQILRDDGRRYYADPFVLTHEGRRVLMCEEVPFATGRGIISAVEMGPDGPLGAPRPVLEGATHLSYPQVFVHDGTAWMIPESTASGRVELYRAARFPDAWELHTVLLDKPLHDATLVEHGGRLWLMGTQATRDASSWDALHLYSADTLTGPWTPHPLNPVLVDKSAARPAGALWRSGGTLLRPAQDCSRGYGHALTLNRITRLDRDGFSQRPVARLSFAGPKRPLGPHTLNRGSGLELLDLFAPPAHTPSRLPADRLIRSALAPAAAPGGTRASLECAVPEAGLAQW